MTKKEDSVQNMVKKMEEKGMKVLYAKCNGFKNPTKIQGKEPDIVGWDSGKQLLHVGLIADPKTIETSEDQEKLQVLSSLQMASGDSKGTHVPFYLGIKNTDNITDKNFHHEDILKENILKLTI